MVLQPLIDKWTKLKSSPETLDPMSMTGSSNYWEERYIKDDKPWDTRSLPLQFKKFIGRLSKPARVLVPGCGSAYEARAFAEFGFEVYAIDFSPAAVRLAQQNMGPWSKNVILGDFFSYDFCGLSFDIVYERAFLCALPQTSRFQYANRMASLLKEGGQLAGFFVHTQKQSGPPFGLAPDELNTLLGDQFELTTDDEVHNSIPLFAGKERWQEWKRLPLRDSK